MNNSDTAALTQLLFVVFGSLTLLLIFTILLATAVTRSGWWSRRKRTCSRLYDNPGRSQKVSIGNKVFHYTYSVVEALSWKSGDDVSTESAITKSSVRPKMGEGLRELPLEMPDLPLRFHPEKLYGATSTVHRDNLRKASFATLSVAGAPKQLRRASMIDSLMTLGSSLTKTSTSKDGERTPTDTVALGAAREDITASTSKGQTPYFQTLPQIDITCEQESDENLDAAAHSSVEDVHSAKVPTKYSSLSINFPTRRASATNIRLTCAASSRDGEESSGIEDSKPFLDVGTPSLNVMRKRKSLPLGKKRGSLTESLPVSEDLYPQTSGGQHDRDSKTSELSDSSQISGFSGETSGLGSKQSDIQPLEIRGARGALHYRLPVTPMATANECPAGMVALTITESRGDIEGPPKLSVEFILGKGIKSLRPWQKSSYSVRIALINPEGTRQYNLAFRDMEFGHLYSTEKSEVLFTLRSKQDSKLSVGDILPKTAQLRIEVVELLPKWSGDKECFQGWVNIPVADLQPSFPATGWYFLNTVYPVIRIKGDLLVSLCQRQLEGVISVGVHEVRNIQFCALGPWNIGDLDEWLDTIQVGIDIHASLTYETRLVKSKKSIQLQRPVCKPYCNKSEEGSKPQQSGSGSTRRTKHSGYRQLMSSEHFMQFSIPAFKHSFGKQAIPGYGIVLCVTSKLPVMDRMPAECVNQVRSAGMSESKYFQALGHCFIGDQRTQAEFWQWTSWGTKCDNNCSSLWNEANSQGSSRVYQWVTLD
ncbi:unnamed protein product [Calicophoron daubneyi]|uniref:Uncharacterized protein n=1 Tax=Calicophoron daubneyi TaxID=300641 RepID=A0AAV2TWU1_CALDB